MKTDLTKEQVLMIKNGEITSKEGTKLFGISNAFFNNIKKGKIKKYEALINGESGVKQAPKVEEAKVEEVKDIREDTNKHSEILKLIQDAKLRKLPFTDGRIFIYVGGELLRSTGYEFSGEELKVDCLREEDFIKNLCAQLDTLKKDA